MDFVNFALHEYFKTLNHHTNWTSPFIWNSNCPCHVQKIFHPNLYMLSTLMYLYSLPIHITLEYKFVSNSVDVPTTTYRIRLMYYVLWKVIVMILKKLQKNLKTTSFTLRILVMYHRKLQKRSFDFEVPNILERINKLWFFLKTKYKIVPFTPPGQRLCGYAYVICTSALILSSKYLVPETSFPLSDNEFLL